MSLAVIKSVINVKKRTGAHSGGETALPRVFFLAAELSYFISNGVMKKFWDVAPRSLLDFC